MRILVVASTYPHPGHPFSGAFNEKCVAALKELCETVMVLAPRVYVPSFLSFVPRWQAYSCIESYEVRNGVAVHRPATPVVPRIGSALWVDQAPFLFARKIARREHGCSQFDAIVSFDLIGTGGIAWRLARDLKIPASGWAFGNDIRLSRSSAFARVVKRALQRLDVVFYQSRELLEKAAEILDTSPNRMSYSRHVVLPHGIPSPPKLPLAETRNRMRRELGIAENQLVILNTGRVAREKGLFELMEAISSASSRDPRITCIIVGSKPAFDETVIFRKKLERNPKLSQSVKILPACKPDKIWEYLCAADLFAFASHNEGMPNSLLEAMAMGLPAIAFGIPPILEIEAGTGALVTVPPFSSTLFAETILRLVASPDERRRLGERGRSRVLDRFMVQKNMAVAVERLAQIKTQSSNT